MKLINLFLRYFIEKYSFLKQGNLNVTFYKFDISEKNQEIVSKSGLMASRPGSRRKLRPVQLGLNQLGMRGGCAFGPTLYQGLSAQGSS